MAGFAHRAALGARRAFVWPIRLYQRWLSPWLPRSCRFAPSCSQYTIEAVLSHGLLKGFALALWRILRCNPFCRGGYDPVPPCPHADADGGADHETR